MATVQPKITSIAVSKTADTITLQDTTGTGYQSPYAPPFVLGYLRWKYWEDTAMGEWVELTPEQMTALNTTDGQAFTPDDVGLVTEEGAVFADGVHHMKYLPVYSIGSCNVLQDSDTITHLGPLSGDPTDIKWIGYPGVDPVEVKSAVSGSTTTITLKELWPYPTDTDVVLYVGTEADLKILVSVAAEKCIVGAIGKISSQPCDCHEAAQQVDQLIRWKFAADVHFDCKNYQGAHDLIKAINGFCQPSDCNC